MKTELTARLSNSLQPFVLTLARLGGGIGIGVGIGRESQREKKYAPRWRKESALAGVEGAQPINQPKGETGSRLSPKGKHRENGGQSHDL